MVFDSHGGIGMSSTFFYQYQLSSKDRCHVAAFVNNSSDYVSENATVPLIIIMMYEAVVNPSA